MSSGRLYFQRGKKGVAASGAHLGWTSMAICAVQRYYGTWWSFSACSEPG